MKKSILLGALILAGMSLTSCNDFLDDNRYPLTVQMNNKLFWDNETNVKQECDYLYNMFYGYGRGTATTAEFYFNTLSDDQAAGSFANWKNTSTTSSASAWSTPYTWIRHAATIIDRLEESSLDPKVKANYIAQARLARAYQYFLLVRRFGDVVWTDHVVETDDPVLYAPRDNRDQVMDKVLEDINYACANISATSGKNVWSKDMAQALKADICLWEGTYCKYRTVAECGYGPDQARAEKYLKECVSACEAIMNSGRYSLNSSYQGNYNSVFAQAKANPEMIFFKAYQDNVMMQSIISYICSSTIINGITKDAFDAYLFKDGKPLALTTMDKSDVGEMDAEGHYSIAKLLQVRDARLSQTTDPYVYYCVDMSWARAGAMAMTSSTGYGVCKYDNVNLPLSSRTQNGKSYTCAPVFWLAVIYCNYAEAKAELGTLTDADLNASLNKLYARAELPAQTVASLSSMNDPANNMNVSSLLWEVRRCRRCELIMDGDYRYWDLIRWHQLDKLDSQKYPNILLGANITASTVPWTNVNGYINASYNKVRTFEPRQYLYPVPESQLQLNPNLGQNPGW